MTTVYVVTSGCYSDYSIDAVFSTRELAEAFKVQHDVEYKFSYSDQANIEEWVLDARAEEAVRAIYQCTMTIHDGLLMGERVVKRLEVPRFTEVRVYRPHTQHPYIHAQSSISAEHARKLAMEKRQEIVALGLDAMIDG